MKQEPRWDKHSTTSGLWLLSEDANICVQVETALRVRFDDTGTASPSGVHLHFFPYGNGGKLGGSLEGGYVHIVGDHNKEVIDAIERQVRGSETMPDRFKGQAKSWKMHSTDTGLWLREPKSEQWMRLENAYNVRFNGDRENPSGVQLHYPEYVTGGALFSGKTDGYAHITGAENRLIIDAIARQIHRSMPERFRGR